MKYTLYTFAALAVLSSLTSCSDMSSAMTPSAKVIKDDFDGSNIIRQNPVSSASKLSESWHSLGFEYVSSQPNKVFLTARTQGVNNIFSLDFNVGGKFIKAKTASLTTDYNTSKYGGWSDRRFYVSYSDFVAIATAPSVKMKASGGNTYGVSSFGTSTKALVNKKFPSFLAKVKALKGN